jgi:23S rRNA pseudouridine2605 synthase
MRINQFLAKCNLGSRRAVEELILEKKIKVNGKIITDLSVQINPNEDTVTYGRKTVELPQDRLYIMLNKPKNYLVSAKDDFGRKTVFDLLPDFNMHLFPVGRLDYHSEGLLLLTSDGYFAEHIIHPRYHLPKVYKVTVKGNISQEQIEKLRSGIEIEGVKTKPALVYVKLRKGEKSVLRMTIFEGKKRQIRVMLNIVGSEVLELKRLQIGDLKLGKLSVGMWRLLKPSEVQSLKAFYQRKYKPKNEEK